MTAKEHSPSPAAQPPGDGPITWPLVLGGLLVAAGFCWVVAQAVATYKAPAMLPASAAQFAPAPLDCEAARQAAMLGETGTLAQGALSFECLSKPMSEAAKAKAAKAV